jgi:hypothetical protein
MRATLLLSLLLLTTPDDKQRFWDEWAKQHPTIGEQGREWFDQEYKTVVADGYRGEEARVIATVRFDARVAAAESPTNLVREKLPATRPSNAFDQLDARPSGNSLAPSTAPIPRFEWDDEKVPVATSWGDPPTSQSWAPPASDPQVPAALISEKTLLWITFMSCATFVIIGIIMALRSETCPKCKCKRIGKFCANCGLAVGNNRLHGSEVESK